MFPERSVRVLTEGENVNVIVTFLTVECLLHSAAMVATKLLLDDKILACIK